MKNNSIRLMSIGTLCAFALASSMAVMTSCKGSKNENIDEKKPVKKSEFYWKDKQYDGDFDPYDDYYKDSDTNVDPYYYYGDSAVAYSDYYDYYVDSAKY